MMTKSLLFNFQECMTCYHFESQECNPGNPPTNKLLKELFLNHLKNQASRRQLFCFANLSELKLLKELILNKINKIVSCVFKCQL